MILKLLMTLILLNAFKIESQTVINKWVKIVPSRLNFVGPANLIQFYVQNWTMFEIGDGLGVMVSW